MIQIGNIAEDATLDFKWNSNNGSGASITRATNGTVSVYKGNNVTQSTAGVTDTEDFDSLTGVHHVRIDTSADAFYEPGYDYEVVLSGATIDSQTVNATLASFSIENRRDEAAIDRILLALPNAAADAAGGLPISDAGGLDMDALVSELAKVPKSDGTVTFNSTALGSFNAEMDTALSDYGPATAAKLLAYFQLLLRSDAAIGTDNSTELTEINADGGSGAGDFSNQTEAVEALRDWIGNGSNLTEAGGNGDHLTEAGGTGDQLTALASQASVDTVTTLVTSTNTNVGQILTDTNEIQGDLTDGGRLDLLIDAIKTNTDSLVARIKAPLFAGMTSLANWLGAIAAKHTPDATAITEINATGAGSGTYDATTDSGQGGVDGMQGKVQLAIEANHLDHFFAETYDPAAKPGVSDALMNELIESDAGVSRFTANALEQAPAGSGGGGDATEAKQDIIIASLGGWTGTGVNNVLGAFQAVFRKDADVSVPSDINADLGSGVGTASNITESLQGIRDRGDSAWTPGGGVTITPLSAGDVQRSTGTTITAYEGETSAITVYAISDVDGNAVDLTTYSALEVVIEDYSGTVLQTIAHGSLGLTDSGNLTFTPSATVTGTVTTTRGGHLWSLRDTTDGDYVVAQGRMNIVRVATDA